MKYKKVIISLLFVSIAFNIVQQYNMRKYKEVVKQSVKNNLTEIFSTSEELQTALNNIHKSSQTTRVQLEEIRGMYNELIVNIQYFNFMCIEFNSKNKKHWNVEFYGDVYEDLERMVSQFEGRDSNSIIELSNDDMIWLNKLIRHVNDINGIGNTYSYVEDGFRHYRIDKWIDIYKELSKFSYYDLFLS